MDGKKAKVLPKPQDSYVLMTGIPCHKNAQLLQTNHTTLHVICQFS